ncbi:hypothetical protein [Fulvivirga ligni]|uniref:hypothetical protein n=1 Tax=Fulvivirga ligni TaxID=2904246 RepID=UPI001F40E7AF|nr:hypothetical protein [Fulvivirga ligni]UII20826.1 hypothetical protein LVD16_23580 [Fulvivirga ligni]
MFIYNLFECDPDGIGNLLGTYSKPEYAVEAAKLFLDSPILYHNTLLATYDDVINELDDWQSTAFLTSESGEFGGCLIIKTYIDLNYFEL